MKRLMFFSIFIFFFTLFLSTENITSKFNEGNIKYKEGKFREALDSYSKESKNILNWKLFYNMGDCYFKLDDFVNAKIYFLKAQRLKPFDSSIQKNLDVVNLKLNIKSKSNDDNFIRIVLLKIESIFSLNFISILLLIIIIISNFFIIMLVLSGRKRILLYGITFSLISLFLIYGYHMYRVKKIHSRNMGVVLSEKARLRSGPGEENTVLYNVALGVKLKIIEQSGNWIYVSESDSIAGWIKKIYIQKI